MDSAKAMVDRAAKLVGRANASVPSKGSQVLLKVVLVPSVSFRHRMVTMLTTVG